MKHFTIRKGYICYLAALSDIMYNGGVDIAEDELFIATSALDMKVEWLNGKFEFRCADLHDDFEMYENKFLNWGWKIEEKTNISSEELYREIHSNLDKNIPMLVGADVFNLPYHPFYQKIHECHIITILDKSKHDLYIADHLVLGSKAKNYLGNVFWNEDLFDLGCANERCKNELWVVKRGDLFIEISKSELIDNLKKNAEKFVNENGHGVFESLSNYYYDIFSVENDFYFNNELIRMDKMLALSGGPCPARQLIGNYFTKLDTWKADILARHYHELANQWKMIATLSIKASITYDRKILEKIVKRIYELKNLELAGAKMILEM